MGVYGGAAPAAPDPMRTAMAQGQVNTGALKTAAQLNQMNQNNPFGSMSYTGEIGTDDRTQNVTLSPELQKILQGQLGSTQALTDLANKRLAGAPGEDYELPESPVDYLDPRANSPLRTDVDPTADQMTTNVQAGDLARGVQAGALAGPVQAGPLMNSVNRGAVTGTFNPGAAVQGGVNLSGQPSLNTNFATLSQQAQDAAYRENTRYLNPQSQQQEDQLRSRLSAQGVTQGSEAHDQALGTLADQQEQAYAAARDQAITQGFGREGQLFGQNLAARQQGVEEQFGLGDFANQALAQQFGQNQSLAGFQNQAQNQDFGQGMQLANLYNQAQGQQFGQGMENLNAYNQSQNQIYNQGMQNVALQNQNQAQQFGQGMQNANLYNQGQGQIYGQGMQNAALQNQVLNDRFNQNLTSQQAYNRAQGQQFGQGLDVLGFNQNQYQQNVNNQLMGRNQNINEAMAYLQGAPITPQNPNFQQFASSTAAQGSPDLIGLAGSNYTTQMNNRSNPMGDIFGAAGKVGAAYFCWVAREVYGKDNPRWLEFREWMLKKAPDSLREMYLKRGPLIAALVKDMPEMKIKLRNEMEAVLGV